MSSGDPTGEWDGLEGPGLVLASEDIRGAVEDILAGEGAGRPLEALVTVGELVVSLELLELRQAPEDVTIVGSCDLSVARSLVGLDLSEWSDVEIFHGSETLRLIPLLGRHLNVSLDLSRPGGCLVTVTSRAAERKKQKQAV